MSDRVTITMTDGTTREVHPDTIVRSPNGLIFRASATANGGYKVTTIFEPTREDWTPYEPWMRDVLADDARMSWASSGTESRSTWGIYRRRTDSWAAGVDLMVCPDDAPERPAEDDPGEWKARYKALRADVEREYTAHPDYPTARILDADDKRGEQT